MALYKRGSVYYLKIKAPDGSIIRRSTGTTDELEAREYHDMLKADLWRQSHLKAKPTVFWQDAVVRWLTEKAGKKSIETDVVHFRWLDAHLKDKRLSAINRDLVAGIVAKKGGSPSTRNRVVALIRSILRAAEREWEWIDKAPVLKLEKEPKRRVRWLKRKEADRLIEELPDHLAEMTRFSLSTGLRASNVTGLRWDQIDMPRRVAWIHADEAKGEKSIGIPINNDAWEVLRRQIGKNQVWVFTYKNKRVLQPNTRAWRQALKRAGITNFRWHDLRHTWASWHVQNGTPLHILQELGAWESTEMVRRYAHLAPGHLAPYASNVDTKMDTGEKTNVLRIN